MTRTRILKSNKTNKWTVHTTICLLHYLNFQRPTSKNKSKDNNNNNN